MSLYMSMLWCDFAGIAYLCLYVRESLCMSACMYVYLSLPVWNCVKVYVRRGAELAGMCAYSCVRLCARLDVVVRACGQDFALIFRFLKILASYEEHVTVKHVYITVLPLNARTYVYIFIHTRAHLLSVYNMYTQTLDIHKFWYNIEQKPNFRRPLHRKRMQFEIQKTL